MLFGIAFEFGLCIVLCYAEPFQKVFGTDALSFMHWCLPLPWFWYGQHGTQPQPQRAAASPAQSQRSAAQQPADIDPQRLQRALTRPHLRVGAATHSLLSCRVVPCRLSVRSLCSA